ncbi:MAG: hypothetical protein HQM16_08325 [Deltaproteobacteria bacterium]|nr:hypothetical protein [Deltaproteobacteria bacterium]
MTTEINLNQPPVMDYNSGTDGVTGKKKSGCGCFLMGCLVVLLIIVGSVIGGGVYISSTDDATWGKMIASFISNPKYSEDIKKGIQGSTEVTQEQKQAFIALYDTFLLQYNNLPEDQKHIVQKNIFVVIKKIITNPQSLDHEPPAELLEIIKVLDMDETGGGTDAPSLNTNGANVLTDSPSDENIVEPDQPTPASGKPPEANYDF